MLSRRAFLKLSLLSLASMAAQTWRPTPPEEPHDQIGLGRVTTRLIYIYQEPSLSSARLGKLYRDNLLPLYEMVRSPKGPPANPRWYRIDGGFVHSGRIQRVDRQHTNPPLEDLPEERLLGQVTVPYTQSYRVNRSGVWTKLYRLYYQSVHWITAIEIDPAGTIWYRLTDERLLIHYFVQAEHLTPISWADLAPLRPDVDPKDKRIVVSISQQTLTAFEGKTVVMHTPISSGLPDDGKRESERDVSTDTPLGSFRVVNKFPARHMGDGYITPDLDAYELPGVPWNMFFHESGYALHGTYWHDNCGTRMSHGCVNMPTDQALWLFRWTDPPIQPGKWYTPGRGTLVQVRE